MRKQTVEGAAEETGIELCKCYSGRGEPARQSKAEKEQQKKVKQSSRSEASFTRFTELFNICPLVNA
jgi:hypothetical protein